MARRSDHARKFFAEAKNVAHLPEALEALLEKYRHDGPWEDFIDYMELTYGTRSLLCDWCKRPVWMALQGFYGGGVWTTDKEHEGPASNGLNEPGTVCSESPDDEHWVSRS
jgi:hypothetical protein